jgi:conjugative relaxase-like TrwC/TraI family protein
VLSIGKLAGGQETYYLCAVADGVEDYYLGSGEAPGRWLGDGAARLDLTGRVDADRLRAVLDGRHPATKASLITQRQPHRVPAFDLTFSAPKGASLLFALGDPQLSSAIRAAHDEAVRQAVAYLEREAGEVRRGREGQVRLGGGGFIAAAFRHRSSRAGDPQLHTHVLVANMTRGLDGRYSALDGRQLYWQAKTAGCLYQAALRHQLAPLGLEWTVRDNGLSELAGIPTRVLRAFSRRRIEIESRMRELGTSTAAGAQAATLDTRKAKEYGVDAVSLVAGWYARADQLGFDVAARDALLHQRTVPAELEPAELARAAADMLGETGLTHRSSAFTRKEAIQAWCRALPDGAEVATIESYADRLLSADGVLGLDPAPVRADGQPGAARSARRYSTRELLAIEADLLARAAASRDAGLATVPDHAVTLAHTQHPQLSDEQRAMVDRLLTSGAGVDVVVGKAGTGKTTALAAARAGWDAAGVPVAGAAVAARAAIALTDGAGIPARTVAQLLYAARTDPAGAIPAYGVLVVDEAGMLGTRDLARLLTLAEDRHTKLVLVGDHRQLPELTAGGAFRALARTLDSTHLHDNRRQHAGWERAALDQLRHGNPTDAVTAYGEHDRITVGSSAADARAALVAAWWQAAITPAITPPLTPAGARSGGPVTPAGSRLDPDAVMLAIRRADVAELNLRARTQLRDAGMLGPQELTVPTGPYSERSFAVGDLVVAKRNAYPHGLINGARGTVTAVNANTAQVTVAFPGRTVTVTRDYLESGGLDHGYALTVHQAQGLTARAAFVTAGDELYREAGYVALSRARAGTQLFVTGAPAEREPEREDCHGVRRAEPRDPITALEDALHRSKAQQLAVDIEL